MSHFKRIGICGLALMLALAAASCRHDASAARVDVGGYHLAYQCFSEGTPTVIIEAGLGEAPTVNQNWQEVIAGIQDLTRICIYDRAGLGQSEQAPTPRTSMDVALDLHTLLGGIPLPGPYILVAHSIGGFHVRVFADRYPQEVAGIILIDSSHPEQFIEFAAAYPTPASGEAEEIAARRPFFVNGPQPEDNAEGLDAIASAEQVREAASLGNTPLMVISRSAGPDDWDIVGFSTEDRQRMYDLYLRLQADLARLSSNSTQFTAQAAGHYIHVDEPQLIVHAITLMVHDIQNR